MRTPFRQRWNDWWFRPCPPHALAIARIAVGVFVCFFLSLYAGSVPLQLSDAGIALPLLAGRAPAWLDPVLQPPPLAVAWSLYVLMFACAVMLAAGFLMRAGIVGLLCTALWAWQLSFHLFPATIHRVLLILLLVLLFSKADRAFSVRMYRRTGSWLAWEAVSILPQRLIALQITASYAGAGWQKLHLPDWQSGEILPYAFLSSWGTPLSRWIVRLNLPLPVYDAVVFLITFFEVTLPIGLWIRRFRIAFMIAGCLFHVAIFFLLSIWSFLFLLPFLYVTFLEPETVHAWLRTRWPGIRPLP